MSTQARQAVANSSKMIWTASDQKADILDPSRTNTYLIAALQWQLDNSYLPILVLSLRANRGTGMHSIGCAIDCYPQNWATNEQATCVDMMKAWAKNPFCEAVGLGGVTWNWRGQVQWPSDYFVMFQDNDSDHIHAAVANSHDPPGKRASAMGYTKYTG